MHDETEKQIEQPDPDDNTSDPEVPMIPRGLSSGDDKPDAYIEHKSRKDYIKSALHQLRWLAFWRWSWVRWLWPNVFMNAALWTAIATVVIAYANIKYTQYAGKQWVEMHNAAVVASNTLEEMKRQTFLSRQQLVGTEAAVLDLSVPYDDGSGVLTVQLSNNGHATAAKIHLSVDASQQKLQDGTLIGDPFHFEPPVQPIPSGKGLGHTWTLPWHLTERERQQGGHWPPDWPGKRTFVFRAEVTYQNGFGDEIRQEVCRQWLPGFSIDYRGQHFGGGGLYDCADIKAFIKSTLEQEKQAEKDAQQTK